MPDWRHGTSLDRPRAVPLRATSRDPSPAQTVTSYELRHRDSGARQRPGCRVRPKRSGKLPQPHANQASPLASQRRPESAAGFAPQQLCAADAAYHPTGTTTFLAGLPADPARPMAGRTDVLTGARGPGWSFVAWILHRAGCVRFVVFRHCQLLFSLGKEAVPRSCAHDVNDRPCEAPLKTWLP